MAARHGCVGKIRYRHRGIFNASKPFAQHDYKNDMSDKSIGDAIKIALIVAVAVLIYKTPFQTCLRAQLAADQLHTN
jgi:hypothetical protein